MKDMRIDRAEVFVVGPDVERYTWAEGMTGPVHGQHRPAPDDGGRARGRRRRGDDHAARLRPLGRRNAALAPARRHGPLLPGARGAVVHAAAARHAAGAAGAVADRHRACGTWPRRPPTCRSTSCWAARAPRSAPMPARRCCIPTRPMSTMSPSASRRASGRSSSIAGASPRATCRCARRCSAHFGDDLALMLDVEQRYDLRSALQGRQALGELDFDWFEAPLPDTDIEGYRQLKRETGVPIIAAGNTWLDLQQTRRRRSRLDCWSSLRVDATICGGITPLRKIMALAEAHRHERRDPVLGLHADPGRQPARHARATATAPISSSPRPIRPSSMARTT